ncbi:MAG: hypothetical protein LBP70_01915 [Mycoplasmataceae bacterium]|nr:hypothetical protein [Mycoplasmataceae bacterium]
MTKQIKSLIFFFLLFLIFIIILLNYLKLHVIANCVFTADATSNSIMVDKHLHNLIDNQSIKACRIEIDHTKYKAWLAFKEEENSNYAYWLSVDNSFAFNNQTIMINVDFGSISIIKYLNYLIV